MEHVDALTIFSLVDEGNSFTNEQADHLRNCFDCRSLLWAYSHQQVRKLQRHRKDSDEAAVAA